MRTDHLPSFFRSRNLLKAFNLTAEDSLTTLADVRHADIYMRWFTIDFYVLALSLWHYLFPHKRLVSVLELMSCKTLFWLRNIGTRRRTDENDTGLRIAGNEQTFLGSNLQKINWFWILCLSWCITVNAIYINKTGFIVYLQNCITFEGLNQIG